MRPQSWAALYELALMVGLTAMLLFAVGNSLLPDVLNQAERRGYSADWFAVALLLFTLGLWVRFWYFAGPLAVSAGRLQWFMWQRDPRGWLRREAVKAYLIGGGLATVLAVLSALVMAAGDGPYLALAVAVWGLLQLFLVLAVQLQRRDLDAVARLLPFILCSLGVVLAVGEAWNGPVSALTGVCLLSCLAVARRGILTLPGTRTELTPRWQLYRGARGRWSLGAGATMLDHEVVRVMRHREAKVTREPLPAFVYRLRWPLGLAGAVLARNLRAVIPTIGLMFPLIFALHRLLGPLPALLLTALLELTVTVTMVRSSEEWLRSNALSRIWGTGGSRVPVALALPGVAVSLAIAAAVSLALGFPPLAALVLLVLPGAIIARRHSARGGSTEFGILATPLGAVPLNTVNRVIAGPDMALLCLWIASWVM
ncbi:hypothetical protein [Streptomyces sp. PT12]|uniref:hypothetical protein n=1 Tax=Streptomyces sp. PT12 TaxID=1510197 RepID=UPI000DE2979F|nr:hypothetical protein [Streptomyces sp. PT12]RBM19621.1 hypothetical protein DEH69_10465 [Streptomyces sp. PT12]